MLLLRLLHGERRCFYFAFSPGDRLEVAICRVLANRSLSDVLSRGVLCCGLVAFFGVCDSFLSATLVEKAVWSLLYFFSQLHCKTKLEKLVVVFN